nr:uncharacterized protein LOC26531920 isoform X1 [Drosophila virilis]
MVTNPQLMNLTTPSPALEGLSPPMHVPLALAVTFGSCFRRKYMQYINLDGTKSRTALRLLFCSYVWTYVNIVALPDVGCRRLARRSLALGPSLFLLLDGLHTP